MKINYRGIILFTIIYAVLMGLVLSMLNIAIRFVYGLESLEVLLVSLFLGVFFIVAIITEVYINLKKYAGINNYPVGGRK